MVSKLVCIIPDNILCIKKKKMCIRATKGNHVQFAPQSYCQTISPPFSLKDLNDFGQSWEPLASLHTPINEAPSCCALVTQSFISQLTVFLYIWLLSSFLVISTLTLGVSWYPSLSVTCPPTPLPTSRLTAPIIALNVYFQHSTLTATSVFPSLHSYHASFHSVASFSYVNVLNPFPLPGLCLIFPLPKKVFLQLPT